MAGRAQGYSDYYKNNDESSEDVEGIKKAPDVNGAQPVKSKPGNPDSVAERRKAAIRRRMMRMKKG